MSIIRNRFFSILNEEESDALEATPRDDSESFKRSLDDDTSANDFDEPERVTEPINNYGEELAMLNEWIREIDNFKSYINGDVHSILGHLKDEAKIGTIFADTSHSIKTDILEIAEKLASLNEQLKNIYIEKNK